MEIIIANVEHFKFDIEAALNVQYGALPLPFPGMDKSTAAVCQFYNAKQGPECDKGSSCPFRHIRGDRTIVCKHWLRGLCKKGDQCEFLHEYDMSKMPECYFYSRFNACHNKECPFLHIDPESKIKDCPWYDRGFCRHGPHCRHRHVRRVLCTNYLAGLCPSGPNCKHMHPRFELPAPPEPSKDVKRPPVCHFCGELGHKATYCAKIPAEQREAAIRQEEAKFRALGYFKPAARTNAVNELQNISGGNNEETGGGVPNSGPMLLNRGPPKPLEEVTCYKCGSKGHYANKCPKGHLAFLSHSQNNQMSPSGTSNSFRR